MGLSCRALQQRFQRVLQRTPKDELMRVQIERARMLLSQTDMNVELVSKRSGFAAFGYFVRAFRARNGHHAAALPKELSNRRSARGPPTALRRPGRPDAGWPRIDRYTRTTTI